MSRTPEEVLVVPRGACDERSAGKEWAEPGLSSPPVCTVLLYVTGKREGVFSSVSLSSAYLLYLFTGISERGTCCVTSRQAGWG